MCPCKLFIFDEFGGISTQLSAMPKTRTRCADSVVRGYNVYMDKWDPSIGDKFNAEIEVSNRRDRWRIDMDGNRHQWRMAGVSDGVWQPTSMANAMAMATHIDGVSMV